MIPDGKDAKLADGKDLLELDDDWTAAQVLQTLKY